MNFQSPLQNRINNQIGRTTAIDPQARRLFERALRAGTSKRRNTANALPNISDETRMSQHYLGAQAVDVMAIGGSVNKSNDFDSHFHPLSEHIEPRWAKVATAMMNGIDLPPVELILVNGTYYVVDGHHRISVARMLGMRYLDALVTVWE
ncbi:MAG: hypothetical protein SFZ02_10860 [bacterium]|nr:hypothetical protein [bacterium]